MIPGLSPRMDDLLRRLRRRLALGLFFDIWPQWVVAGFLVAGGIALVCRMFLFHTPVSLLWLWLSPVIVAIPAAFIVARRAFHPAETLALADSLCGGHGALLTLAETGDSDWTPELERMSSLVLPRFQLWGRMKWLLPAAGFLALALAAPQRAPAAAGTGAIAREVVRDLEQTLAALKEQELVTPEEEKKLEEEIERLRKGAMERIDSSTWEAADALQEKMVADLSAKQDALRWAEESLFRYADAAQGGASPSEAQDDELAKAIQKLAENGMLGGLTPELERLLGGKEAIASGEFNLPSDARSRERLAESLSELLGRQSGRLGDLARLGREFSRFDPDDFPLDSDSGSGEKVEGMPGNGGVDRGRGDAELTWGQESQPFDKFKAQSLPPGAMANPDDWAPIAALPGAPKAAPENGPAAAPRDYASGAGQAAWRRTLAPRHYSAVKNYFEK
ncbi:MAG TPA: hypothetical protein VFY29_11440 [Terriglobia bacterium]|nr:hypothetical protein [Terriglobia bacterium]